MKPARHSPGRARVRQFAAAIALALLLTTLPVAAAEKALRKITFLPQWYPQAQFAGYYVAKEKGFYRSRGIDAVMLRGGPTQSVEEALRGKRADMVTLFLAEGVRLRAGGLRIVDIAQVVQRSGYLLVARKASGVVKPADLDGRKVGLWEHSRVQATAFFRKHGVHPVEVRQSFTPNLFLRGGVDAASAMVYNEYHTLLNAGLDAGEMSVFALADHGINFPEDGIWCLEEFRDRNPGISRDFAEASLEGWRYAFAHPEEALDIVMKYVDEAGINTSRNHQRWMLRQMEALIRPPGPGRPPGLLARDDYERVTRALVEAGIIAGAPPYGDIHVQGTGSP